ncbi:MAG: hypothetical protein WCJ33_09005, partial [Pseudomonadota bacterium]
FKVNNYFSIGPIAETIKNLLLNHSLPSVSAVFAPMQKGYTLDLVVIAGFWALYNAIRAGFFIIQSIRNAKNSNEFFRFPIPLPATISQSNDYLLISEISENWARIKSFEKIPNIAIGDKILVTAFLPSGTIELILIVEKIISKSSKQGYGFEGSLVWESNEKRDILCNCLYSLDWHREFLNRQPYFITPIDFIAKIFSFKKSKNINFKNSYWKAVLFSNSENNKLQYGVLASKQNSSSLIAFSYMKEEIICEGLYFKSNSIEKIKFIIMNEQPISSLIIEGLDGTIVRRYKVKLISCIKATDK